MNPFLPAVALAVVVAQSQPGTVRVWKSTDIDSKSAALAKKLDPIKFSGETLATDGNRTFMLAHREGSGLAEIHDTQADIMVISKGQVTMVYGGTVVDGKTTAPNETRGSAIKGGTEVKLGPGDILHIPAKVPHQMKLDPGTQVTYFVTKVVQ